MEIKKNNEKPKINIDRRGRISSISCDIDKTACKILRYEIAADPAGSLCLNVFKCP